MQGRLLVALCASQHLLMGITVTGVVLLWLFQSLSFLPVCLILCAGEGALLFKLQETLGTQGCWEWWELGPLQPWGAFQPHHDQSLLQVLWDQNGMLRRELERLRLQLQESRAERGLPVGGKMQKGSVPLHLLHKNKFLLDWNFPGCVGTACYA